MRECVATPLGRTPKDSSQGMRVSPGFFGGGVELSDLHLRMSSRVSGRPRDQPAAIC